MWHGREWIAQESDGIFGVRGRMEQEEDGSFAVRGREWGGRGREGAAGVRVGAAKGRWVSGVASARGWAWVWRRGGGQYLFAQVVDDIVEVLSQPGFGL